MRLIDADAYKDYICRNCIDVGYNFYGAKDISKCPCIKVLEIDYRPTAYDVDKVVEEINEESWEYMSDFGDTRVIDFVDAIDIVRRGGVDEHSRL